MDEPQKQTTKKSRIKYDSTKSLIEGLENFKLKTSSEKRKRKICICQKENTCKVFDDITKEVNNPRISKRVLEYEKYCTGIGKTSPRILHTVVINCIEEW